MNILIIYDHRQTYTNTVFEHLAAFSRYSSNNYFFCGLAPNDVLKLDMSSFDALCIHYSIRLPHDGLSEESANLISNFHGFKFAFLQDEYEGTSRAIYWLNRLSLNLVFTVVPQDSIEKIYPPDSAPRIKFVNNLTGYVPENIPLDIRYIQPSKRQLVIGYRGRSLPLRFGSLGFEKVSIGKIVKSFCDANSILNDIAWDEGSRVYGDAWYSFVASCKCTLGTESGSNIFDWDGNIEQRITDYRKNNAGASDDDIYRDVLSGLEIPGLMNQISPKIFEAISLKTALILYEGSYSSILTPWKNFIPLKKDGSNLCEIFNFISDDSALDEMVETTYHEIISDGNYSYNSFVQLVDEQIERASTIVARQKRPIELSRLVGGGTSITTVPIRAESSMPPKLLVIKVPDTLMKISQKIPTSLRPIVRKLLCSIEGKK